MRKQSLNPEVARNSRRHLVIVHYYLKLKTGHSVVRGQGGVNNSLINKYYPSVSGAAE